jgi:phage terminase small subunit
MSKSAKTKRGDDLNERQRLFILEYLKDLNATQAAIRAGYSKKTADQQSCMLLKHPKVREELDRLKAERSERTRIDADWLLTRLADEANADISDLIDENDAVKPIKDWPPIWRKGLVAGIDVEQMFAGSGENRKHIGNTVKVRLSDRVKRLELIGRHIKVGAFEDKLKHNVSEPLAELFRQISGSTIRPREED